MSSAPSSVEMNSPSSPSDRFNRLEDEKTKDSTIVMYDDLDDPSIEEYLKIKSMVPFAFDYFKLVSFCVGSAFLGFLPFLLFYWFPKYFIFRLFRRIDPSLPLIDADFIFIDALQFEPDFIRLGKRSKEELEEQKCYEEIIVDGGGKEKLERARSRLASAAVAPPMGHSFLPAIKSEFMWRHSKFRFNESKNRFERVGGMYPTVSRDMAALLGRGLSSDEHLEQIRGVGLNLLHIIVPSIPVVLVKEVLHPFYIFQIYSVILWYFEVYYVFASTIIGIACISVLQTLIETRTRLRQLAELAHFECQVEVIRDGTPQTVSSATLVPGDIIIIQNDISPCDIAVLEGGCVVNESMLTGESVPVLKSPVQWPPERETSDRVIKDLGTDTRTTVFAATKVVQLKPSNNQQHVLGMVVRTGFTTTKGNLILSILYPKPSSFGFLTQSYKFTFSLFCIALLGFALSEWQLTVQGDAKSDRVLKGFDLITVVVPPSLPLALTVGTNFALSVLKKEKIFCISPSRINMAGKVKCMAFDKTGTLTEDSLRFQSVVLHIQKDVEEHKEQKSSDMASCSTREGVDSMMTLGMAVCQSLAVMDSGEFVGDPLEVQTFEQTKAKLQDSGELFGNVALVTLTNSEVWGIKESFEFSSALQRMSVIAHRVQPTEQQGYMAFVKGSPEMIGTLSLPHTLPENYAALLNIYTLKGYRVIAMGYKPMDSVPSIHKTELRALVEKDLIYLGLILLENKVKPETKGTLEQLRGALIRVVMVTGDNQLTAMAVGKDCGLLENGTRIFQSIVLPAKDNPNMQPHKRIQWVDTEDDKLKLDENLRIYREGAGDDEINDKTLDCRYELAVTGPAFKMLSEMPGAALLDSYFHRVVLNGQIFARMTPDQKALLVSELQILGISTGFCGDGANDCGALKAAHVGVSLSVAEASIAAPFTYTRPNIECVPVLLSEGRGSLITSFQLFKFMAMYSMIQFGAVIITYWINNEFGDWQYLMEDLPIVFVLTLALGGSPCNRNLSVKRPSGNLLSKANIFNLVTHVLVIITCQVAVFEYITVLGIKAGDPGDWEVSAVYYFSNFQYPVMACLFGIGFPWKKFWFLTNYYFTVSVVLVLALCTYLLFSASTYGFWRADDIIFPVDVRLHIFYVLLINFAVSLLFELFLFPFIVKVAKESTKSQTTLGTCFGRLKPLDGPEARLKHVMRSEFESNWYRGRGDVMVKRKKNTTHISKDDSDRMDRPWNVNPHGRSDL